MRTLWAWTWKEAREHRAFLRLLHLALPGLVALAAVIARRALSGADAYETAAGIVGVAVLLNALGVASALFSTDLAEGGAGPAQRLPGALGLALAAKGLVLLLSAALAALAGGLWTAGALWVAGQPEAAWGLLTPWEARDGELLGASLLHALAFSGAVALAACWLRRPGAALVGGVLLAAVFLGATAWAAAEHGYAFGLAPGVCALRALLALAAVTLSLLWSWLGGRRTLQGGAGAALRGLAVLLACAGVAGTSAAATIERWRGVDARDPAWRIAQTALALDGRHAVVIVERPREAWPLAADAGARGTVAEARRIDLATGAWERVGALGALPNLLPLSGPNWPEVLGQVGVLRAVPCVALSVPTPGTPYDPWSAPYDLLWIDPSSGAELHRQPFGHPDARGHELTRRLLAALATTRDSRGRRVFLHEGFLEREDGQGPVGIPEATRHRPVVPVRATRGGLALRFAPGQGGSHGGVFLLVDPDTGAVRTAPQPELGPAHVLSARHLLRLGSVGRGPYDWRVLDLHTGLERPAQGVPADRLAVVVADDLLLTTLRVDGRPVLGLWDPRAGEQSPVTWEGAAPEVSGLCRVTGPDAEGRWLLHVGAIGPQGSQARALAVFDAGTRRARVVSTVPEALGRAEELRIGADGAVLRVERERAIVRYGPEAGRREVLFPRTGAGEE